MRLLHTTDLTLKEFFDDDIPQYGILSHTWGSSEEEVSYQDFLTSQKLDSSGYEKIRNACRCAAIGAYKQPSLREFNETQEWIWIDTCCIDKSSSAELSEAINSMYRWYKKASTCYVYLDDVDSTSSDFFNMKQFRHSKWFTRGWTLQELLAPGQVYFLDKYWLPIGDKETLQDEISSTTQIPRYILLGFKPADVPVALKMQWAARRQTSRREDIAYCLLGIFEINMPLLYGEGKNAFRRLQMEIIRSSNDESIFAWGDVSPLTSALAQSPFEFSITDRTKEYAGVPFRSSHDIQRPPFTITNQGLEIRVPEEFAGKNSMFIPLNCSYPGTNFGDEVYAIAVDRCGPVYIRARRYGMGPRGPDARWRGPCGPVPRRDLWTRDTLKKTGSDVIYLEL